MNKEDLVEWTTTVFLKGLDDIGELGYYDEAPL
jgi:hypothetical protein